MIKILVSSCLVGAPVRHDARDKKCDHAVLERWIAEGRVVSICPEMLGGLGTPRPPAEIVNDGSRRVVTRDGNDVTSAFENGARAAMEQGRAENVRIAILKAGSPSCGSSFIYDGTSAKRRFRATASPRSCSENTASWSSRKMSSMLLSSTLRRWRVRDRVRILRRSLAI